MKTIRKRAIIPALLAAGALGYLAFDHLGRNREADSQSQVLRQQPESLTSNSPYPSLPGLEQLTGQVNELEQAILLAGPSQRSELLIGFVQKLDVPAIRRMLAVLDRGAGDAIRADLQRSLYEQWARINPQSAATDAEKRVAESERMGVLLAILQQWATRDARGAAEWVRSAGREALMEKAARFVVAELEKLDRALAGDFLAALSAGQVQDELTDSFVTTWSDADFDATLKWAQKLSPGATQQRALVHLSYRWEQVDAGKALAYAQSLPEGNDQLVTLLASRWAGRDPQAAATWVVQLPEGNRKEQLMACTTAVWAQKNPEAAAANVATLPSGDAQCRAAIAAVSAWSTKDPAAAARWVENFPAGHTRESAIENIVYRWAQSDPIAAVAWLNQWPAGSDRDAAVSAGAGGLVRSRPDMAVQWAAAIEDQTIRKIQVERAARRWLETDPSAASAWIASSSLSADLKSQLQ
jgi:hypothetical protein